MYIWGICFCAVKAGVIGRVWKMEEAEKGWRMRGGHSQALFSHLKLSSRWFFVKINMELCSQKGGARARYAMVVYCMWSMVICFVYHSFLSPFPITKEHDWDSGNGQKAIYSNTHDASYLFTHPRGHIPLTINNIHIWVVLDKTFSGSWLNAAPALDPV